MPTIPLLKANLDLAMPKVDALDLVPRPHLDLRGVIHAMGEAGQASQRPLVDERPFVEAAGAGAKAIGGALMDVGSVFELLARKQQKAVDDKARHSFYADHKDARGRLQSRYQGERDTTKYLPAAEREMAGLQKAQENMKGVSPGAQADMALMHGAKSSAAKVEAITQERKTKFAEARAAITRNIDTAIQGGEYEQARLFARERHEGLYADDFETEDTLARIDALERDDLATVNPRLVMAELGKPAGERVESMRDLTPADDERFRRATMDGWKKSKALAMDVVHQKLASKEIRNAADFHRQRHAGRIDPLKHLDDEEVAALEMLITYPVNDTQLFEEAHRMIVGYDAHADETGVQRATLSSEIDKQFAGGMREELQSQLAKQTGRTLARGRRTMDLAMDKALAELNDALEAGGFGVWKIPYQYQPVGPYSLRNVSWDEARGTWVRDRFKWENGPERVPVEISQEQAGLLTDSKVQNGEFIIDLRTRRTASEAAGAIRKRLEDGIEQREFKRPEDLEAAFRSLMDGPAKEKARKDLNKRGDETPPAPGGEPPGSRPVTDPNAEWDRIKRR